MVPCRSVPGGITSNEYHRSSGRSDFLNFRQFPSAAQEFFCGLESQADSTTSPIKISAVTRIKRAAGTGQEPHG